MVDRVAAVQIDWRGSAMADVARAHRSSVLHGYGAPFSMVFLPTGPWRHGDLT
jgi:hypothetical protein